MALDCFDPATGRLVFLPFSGGRYDQPEELLEQMSLALRTWRALVKPIERLTAAERQMLAYLARLPVEA